MRYRLSGTVCVVLAAIMWSIGGLMIKKISLDPVLIAAARNLFAGLVLAPFIRRKEIKFSWPLLLLLFCYGGLCLSFVVATKWTAAANVIALQSSAPLWIFLVSTLVYRKFVVRQAIPVGVIVLGLVAILLEPSVGNGAWGNLLAVGAGILFAGVITLLHHLGGQNSIGLIALCNLTAAPVIWLLVPDKGAVFQIDPAGWALLVILGVVQLGIPYVFFAIGLRSITAQKASLLALLEPILNPVWVWLFYGEIPTVYCMVGGVMILTGLTVDALFNSGFNEGRVKQEHSFV